MKDYVTLLLSGFIGLIGCFFGLRYYKTYCDKDKANAPQVHSPSTFVNNGVENSEKSSVGSSHASKKRAATSDQDKKISNLLVGSLKAFTHPISALALDTSGRHIFVASTNSLVRLYTLTPQETSPLILKKSTFIQSKLGSDFVIAADFDYTGLGFIFAASGMLLCTTPALATYFAIKESDTMVYEHHRVRWLYSSKASWILTGGDDNHTEIKIFNYDLFPLVTLDTKQIKNFQMAVSQNQYFACAAWVAGIKIEKISTQNNQFLKCEKIIDIPTRCGTTAVAFCNDNKHCAVADKNGQLYIYNIDVRYQVGQDPELVTTKVAPTNSLTPYFDQLVYSFDGSTLAGISGPHISFFDAQTLEQTAFLYCVHSSPIVTVLPFPSSPFLLTVAANDYTPSLWRFP